MQNDISRQWAFLPPLVPGDMLTAQAQQVEGLGMARSCLPCGTRAVRFGREDGGTRLDARH